MKVEKILLIQEKNCKIPKRFSQKFTPDHLERLITESTTFKELIEKPVIYYSLWDTLKSLQHRPKARRYKDTWYENFSATYGGSVGESIH